MRTWLTWLLVAAALMVASWAVLVVLARRLPPGPLRELARFVPDGVTAIRRLRGDPRVPRRAKVAVVLAGLERLLGPPPQPIPGPGREVPSGGYSSSRCQSALCSAYSTSPCSAPSM
jgi:hypothetical protein